MKDLFTDLEPERLEGIAEKKRELARKGECQHEEDKILTIWEGESFERLTWTCKWCGRIRGRVA